MSWGSLSVSAPQWLNKARLWSAVDLWTMLVASSRHSKLPAKELEGQLRVLVVSKR
jgi:hypothetical protein